MLKRMLSYAKRAWKLERSRRLITCGNNTEISGVIDKRACRSQMMIGNDCFIQGNLVTETDESVIKIGNNVYIGGGTILDCVSSITIDDDAIISYQCILADSDNHSVHYSVRKRDVADWKSGNHDWSTTNSSPIRISKGVWIGARSIILKGVQVGMGAVIGAGSVVTKDVEPWTVVAGNPARVVKVLPENER